MLSEWNMDVTYPYRFKTKEEREQEKEKLQKEREEAKKKKEQEKTETTYMSSAELRRLMEERNLGGTAESLLLSRQTTGTMASSNYSHHHAHACCTSVFQTLQSPSGVQPTSFQQQAPTYTLSKAELRTVMQELGPATPQHFAAWNRATTQSANTAADVRAQLQNSAAQPEDKTAKDHLMQPESLAVSPANTEVIKVSNPEEYENHVIQPGMKDDGGQPGSIQTKTQPVADLRQRLVHPAQACTIRRQTSISTIDTQSCFRTIHDCMLATEPSSMMRAHSRTAVVIPTDLRNMPPTTWFGIC